MERFFDSVDGYFDQPDGLVQRFGTGADADAGADADVESGARQADFEEVDNAHRTAKRRRRALILRHIDTHPLLAACVAVIGTACLVTLLFAQTYTGLVLFGVAAAWAAYVALPRGWGPFMIRLALLWLIIMVSIFLLRNASIAYSNSSQLSRMKAEAGARDRFTNDWARTKPMYVGFSRAVKGPLGALILTGFGEVTDDARRLAGDLNASGIMVYVPQVPGWGLGDMHLAEIVEHEDWMRAALQAYDVLKFHVDEVVVIGHSAGAGTAAFVASRRACPSQIWIAPHFRPSAFESRIRWWAERPVIGSAFGWIMHTFHKPWQTERGGWFDVNSADYQEHGLGLLAVPSHAGREMWKLMDKSERMLRSTNKATSHVLVMFGTDDHLIGDPEPTEDLIRKALPPSVHMQVVEVPGAGHEWFVENDDIYAHGWSALSKFLEYSRGQPP
jgi:alpha-beta hydrolase superfamily lysophospholipase